MNHRLIPNLKNSISTKVNQVKKTYHGRFLITVTAQILWITFNAQTNWMILGFWSHESTLGRDLKYVAESVTCDRNQSFFTSIIAKECDNFYGIAFLRFLRAIGFGLNNYQYFYIAMTGTTIIVTSLLFCTYSKGHSVSKKIFWFFTLFGPYYLLLINRGNIDQTIFCMLVIATYFTYLRQSQTLYYALIFCSLFKFYTLPLLIIYVFSQFRKTLVIWLPTLAVTFEIIRELQQINFLPIRNISSSFGASIFSDYFSKMNDFIFPFQSIFIIFIFSLTCMTATFALKEKSWANKSISIVGIDSLRDLFLLQHFFCFIVFLNYDWRLIFLIFSLFMHSHYDTESRKSRYYIPFSLTVAWASAGFNQIAIVGDVFLYSLFVYVSLNIFATILNYGKNFLHLEKFK